MVGEPLGAVKSEVREGDVLEFQSSDSCVVSRARERERNREGEGIFRPEAYSW